MTLKVSGLLIKTNRPGYQHQRLGSQAQRLAYRIQPACLPTSALFDREPSGLLINFSALGRGNERLAYQLQRLGL
ncbi:MAG TPA: hypothetical protein PLW65_00740 [Pseudomonadota bacterium]|nr:hypothetical protein [Pseudomonadota bacterium]